MTLQHYNNKEELVATLQYPHEKWPIPERNIGFENSEYNLIRSRLHVDIDDCIGCLQCEKVCPVDCIKIDTIKPPKGTDVDFGITSLDTQKKMLVTRFTIDMAECMYCNLCAYPCPEECIYMVGGPNEHKHEIDYEFSQYKRDGLIYEFADPTEAQLAEVGGESYVESRKNQKQKLEDGSNLDGFVEEDQKSVVVDDSKESVKKEVDSGLTLKIFNDVGDKPARGVAKKAFQAAKRAKMDYVAMADYVNGAINDAGKSSPEMAAAIELIRSYKDETAPTDTSVSVATESSPETPVVEATIATNFDVKSLNDIEDKMSRGIAKKAFTGAKRENLDTNGKIDAIKLALSKADKMTDEIETLLSIFRVSDEAPSAVATVVAPSVEVGLFDIKLLNDIDDRMARGSAKKVYMAGKRGEKSSSDVLSDIREELNKTDMMNDEIENLLKGIG
jgi:formate hydrogenlyase subunit 6/NADH:ubiquinone oxidoreductase subunit I